MSSPDGITWTNRTAPAANNWDEIVWSPALEIFLALSNNGTNRAMISSDGVNWVGHLILARSWAGLCWAEDLGIFCATASAGSPVNQCNAISANGTSWTYGDLITGLWRCVIRANGLFVALEYSNLPNNTRVATSTDGITWTLRTTPALTGTPIWTSLAFSPILGRFIAVGNSGIMMYSDDAIVWAIVASGTANHFTRVRWVDEIGLFLAATANATIGISADGVTWSYISLGADNRDFAYSEILHRVVMVSATGGNRVHTNDAVPFDTGTDDAPRNVLVEVSNNNREWYVLEEFEDLEWPL